jgi:hypothetical protein
MGNFLTRYRQESIWDRRGATAFALAPLASSAVYTLLFGGPALGPLLYSTLFAYLQMLVLGLPLTFLLNRSRNISLLTSAIAGGITGALPWMTFIGITLFRSHQAGHPNPDEGPVLMIASVLFSSLGVIGGVAWWLIACHKKRPVTV